ncbi:MAG: HAMP domain-containing protein [Chloroflexi bacterium]|nr:HAMP domain-containing protein [Chloroflexota bacterium]
MPYLLLTLAVAGVGAFVIINLVASSLQERFTNQLLDAGRLVAESTVQYEEDRLQTLRAVVGTIGVPEALANADPDTLAQLVPQIIVNSNSHVVKLLDMNGDEVFGWQLFPSLESGSPIESFGDDGDNFAQDEEIRQVLDGVEDAFGDKRILLHETQGVLTLYTIGPVFFNDEQVGVALVGDEVRQMTVDLTIAAVARVTLYDKRGQLLETTLGGGQESDELAQSLVILNESEELYEEVTRNANEATSLRRVDLLGQEYLLAYGDWRLRGQSAGMFSVALSSNFIISTVATSRNLFSAIFALATIGVLAVGFLTAQQIIRPVDRLVETAQAVSTGDLEQRSGIKSRDEIGELAKAFDFMTQTLAHRNQELTEQASKLEAVINSIVDGVIVLDMDDQFITINVAAQKLLADMSHDFSVGPLRELAESADDGLSENNGSTLGSSFGWTPKDYQIGNRVLNTRAASVRTPEGNRVGTVIVLRDITSEAEAGRLKDAFITTVSHELRTPLTVIKVYTDLILKTADGQLDERYLGFLQKISKNSAHLEQHINQLINISEIQAGTFNLDRKRVDFGELVRAATENWRERLASKELTFDVQLPENPAWIFADSNQLSWAVEVLFSNAHNYTLQGGVKARVFVENDEARLDVIDTGIGIATADQPRLFERFFRASNAVNYNVRGVGLGLFVTRSIVELHDGRIWLESESGRGSSFSLALPLIE